MYPPTAGRAHGRFTRLRRGDSQHMYFVYVLKSEKDNKLYTGFTNNLNRRIAEHNKGKLSTPSTRNRGPFKLVYSEKVDDRKTARAREKYFKSGSGREFIKNTIPV